MNHGTCVTHPGHHQHRAAEGRGILTVNRGTLPMLVLEPAGYAALLGWLAIPVLLAQAAAPTFAAPLIATMAAPRLLLLAGGVAALAASLLLPLGTSQTTRA